MEHRQSSAVVSLRCPVGSGLRSTHGYYLDVPFGEILAHQATKPIAGDTSEMQLRDRYRARDLLPVSAGTVDRTMNDTGLAHLSAVDNQPECNCDAPRVPAMRTTTDIAMLCPAPTMAGKGLFFGSVCDGAVRSGFGADGLMAAAGVRAHPGGIRAGPWDVSCREVGADALCLPLWFLAFLCGWWGAREMLCLVRSREMSSAFPRAGARRMTELAPEEAVELLASVPLGRIGFSRRALPVIRPVNHLVEGGYIVIRTHVGSAVLRRSPVPEVVVYEADHIDLPSRSDWSVMVTGRAGQVADPLEVTRYQRLLVPWIDMGMDMDQVVKISMEIITGYRIGP
ncbi:pyridoxamine 5'-phosphate oxidase family protein [Streptomyces sp. NPDC091280]|uniref:pyridoxamine 5'-phosphate oxidase family protein n=1 Tax=Streptomyces sp. NPDC091280 TaxID=3365984 RepID=UPI0037FDE7FC